VAVVVAAAGVRVVPAGGVNAVADEALVPSGGTQAKKLTSASSLQANRILAYN